MTTMPNRIEICGKWISEEYQKGWNACIEATPEAIPVEWLKKRTVEKICERNMPEAMREVIYETIAEWEKEK